MLLTIKSALKLNLLFLHVVVPVTESLKLVTTIPLSKEENYN